MISDKNNYLMKEQSSDQGSNIMKNSINMKSCAGGHPSRFRTSEEGEGVIMKMTNCFEVEAYEKIFTRDELDQRYVFNLVF